MHRYFLLIAIIISVVIVAGSYLLSNQYFAIDTDEIETTAPNTLNVQTPSQGQDAKVQTVKKKTTKGEFVGRNTDSFSTPEQRISLENQASLSEQEEFSAEPEDFSDNSAASQKSSTQEEQNQAAKNDERRERNYLTLEETQRAERLSAQIMDPATSPERRRELIDMYNELVRPVLGGTQVIDKS